MAKPLTASLPQAAAIVSRWDLDEASGNAADSVGSNTLTDTNTVGSASEGPVSGITQSRDFEAGSTEYFTIADNASLSQTGSITIGFWVKPESIVDYTVWVAKWTTGTNNRSYYMYNGSDGRMHMGISVDGTAEKDVSIDAGSAMSAGTWYHMVGVFEASTRIELYKNGVSGNTDTSSIPSGIFNSTSTFDIGRETTGGNYADGLMSDAILWSVALTDAEVAAYYAAYSDAVTTLQPHSFFM